MRKPRGVTCHECAPKQWRQVPRLTGDYDMDASLMRIRNKDAIGRLKHHVVFDHVGYGPVTNYNGYRNYSGDD